MSEKRFVYGETDLFEWIEENGKMISTKECVDKLNEYQVKLEILEKILPKELSIECQRCKFFVAYRNFNYEKMTNDTITIYCDLLQNKKTYDRDTGDVIWENGWLNECPLRKGGFYEYG